MSTLKDLREEALLSQAELAKLLGVSRQAVWDWEHGESSPSPANRRKLVEVLHKEPREILAAIRETQKQSKADERAAA